MTTQAQPAIEILDLVNENDEVIGEVEKDVANTNPNLIHREVGIFIFQGARVLVQQRSFKKKRNPGMWTIAAAGHVSKGASYEETAHRELKEELGFDTKLIPFTKFLVKDEKETHFSYCYIGEYNKEQIALQAEEVEQYKLITEEEFRSGDLNFGKGSKTMLSDFWYGKLNDFIAQLSNS